MDGSSIRDLRRRVGMTQRELGEYLDVDQGTVSRWERDIESPRPARQARLQELLLRDEDRRHFDRSVAMVRNDLLPATLLDDRLRLIETSASARQHFRDRGSDTARLMGVTFDRYADRMGFPELSDHVRDCGLTNGDALIFRFTMNIRGKGHTTVWEPVLRHGRLACVLNYVSAYFEFEANDEVTLESVDFVPSDVCGRLTALYHGTRSGGIARHLPRAQH